MEINFLKTQVRGKKDKSVIVNKDTIEIMMLGLNSV